MVNEEMANEEMAKLLPTVQLPCIISHLTCHTTGTDRLASEKSLGMAKISWIHP